MSDELEQEIESLRRMSRQRLQDRWRTLYKAAPPAAFTPDLLARGIAWRMQETALGGLSADAKCLLALVVSASHPTLGERFARAIG